MAVLLVAALACACASTHQRGRDAIAAGGTRSGLGAGGGVANAAGGPGGAAAGDAATTATSALAAGGVDSGGTTGAGGAASGGGAGAAGGGTSAIPVGARVNGVDARTIKVGVRIITKESAAAFANAMGAQGLSPGDTQDAAQAMIDELNAGGGIAGRRIVPYYVEYDLAKVAAGQASSEAQRHCEAFANDGKVFVAVSPLPASKTLAQCLEDHRIPYVQDSVGWYFDDDIMATVPDFYMPAEPQSSRLARFWIAGLQSERYFDAGTKLGVVRLGGEPFDRIVKEDLAPALAAAGQSIAVEAVISDPQQVGAGVLKFRTEGVNHVLVLDDNGLLAILWMNQAESQHFRPRYGLNSINLPSGLPRNVPAGQLDRSVGIGWYPPYDAVPAGASDRPSPEDERCVAVLRKHGVALDTPTAYGVGLYTCDVFLFLKTALDRAGEVSPAGIRASVARLGTGYRPTGTFGATFGPARRDGANAARPLRFDNGCTCFRYSGRAYATP